MRHPVILSSKEDDFRKIGLLPPLTESDDPSVPRDIPSPDPATLGGLDDSEGEKSAQSASAKQPKPKMGPAADDSSVMDPDEDGGSAGAQKGGSGGGRVAGTKEASIRAESAQYIIAKKQPGLKGKGKNAGKKPAIAKGLKPVDKKVGMVKESRFSAANNLIEEVQGLLRSVEIDEEIDQLLRSFRLVAENSVLLADRLTEISDQYKVEHIVAAMEELSQDAVEALEAVEAELETMDGESDEDEAVRHSSDVSEADEGEKKPKSKLGSDRDADEVYDIPSPAFKEEVEDILQLMVGRLMDAVEAYDVAIDHMLGESFDDEGEDSDPRHEIHIHTKAHKVHVHHHGDEADADDDADMSADADPDADMEDPDADPDADMGDEDPDMDMSADDGSDMEDPDADMGDEDPEADDADDDSDHETNSLVTRMKDLRARREAMGGGRSFR